MIGSTVRLQDFELEAKAALTETATYGQAEVDAIRRSAFAAGRADGQAAAAKAAAAADADRLAAVDRMVQQAADLSQEVDVLLDQSLDRLESVLRAALTIALPALAASEAMDRLSAALHEAAAAVPLPSIEVIASPATVERLRACTAALPARLMLTADEGIADGAARLRWQSGGADFSPNAAVAAIEQALETFLGRPDHPGSEASVAPPPNRKTHTDA